MSNSEHRVSVDLFLTSRPLSDGLTELSIRGEFVTLVIVPEAGGQDSPAD